MTSLTWVFAWPSAARERPSHQLRVLFLLCAACLQSVSSSLPMANCVRILRRFDPEGKHKKEIELPVRAG